MSLRRAWRLALREGRSLFSSPGGYIVVGIFWLVAGLLLVSLLFRYREAMLQLAETAGMRTQRVGLHVNDFVIRPLTFNLGMVLIFFVPLLTMKSVAEERRTGNLELLLSQPLRGGELVLGKFFGALLTLGVCLGVLLIHALVLLAVSRPDWGAAAAGFLGLLLMGGCFCAVGLLLSILSRSQVEAGVLTLGALLALFLGPEAMGSSAGREAGFVRFISMAARFEDCTRGLLDLGHVAFFLGLTFLFLALALRCLDLVRWQG
jgi:ABC-2 type transport system permease protein